MARERSPDRDRAEKMYLESGGKLKLKDIAAELGLGDTQIRKWKSIDKWDKKLKSNVTNNSQQDKGNVTKRKGAPKGNKYAVGNKGGAPKGNKNGIGNRGGPGGPPGNKKGLKTGEHETIWLDTLEKDEQSLVGMVQTDPIKQANEEIILLSIRERRMLQRIKNLVNGLSEKQRRVLQERKSVKKATEVYDEKTGVTRTVVIPSDELVTTQIEETEFRAIEDILRIEDALTRVQDKKLKAIELKFRLLGEDDEDQEEGDGLESLTQAIEESKKLLAGDL